LIQAVAIEGYKRHGRRGTKMAILTLELTSAFEFCCDAQIAHGQIICRPAINLWSPPLFWFGAL